MPIENDGNEEKDDCYRQRKKDAFMFSHLFNLDDQRPTICVTGGWGEQSSKTENCHSSKSAP
jgi:hypothetical protein